MTLAGVSPHMALPRGRAHVRLEFTPIASVPKACYNYNGLKPSATLSLVLRGRSVVAVFGRVKWAVRESLPENQPV